MAMTLMAASYIHVWEKHRLDSAKANVRRAAVLSDLEPGVLCVQLK